MLVSLPYVLRGIIAAILLVINTLALAPFIIILTILRIVVPLDQWRRFCTAMAIKVAELWISLNSGWMRMTQKLEWDVEGIAQLDKNHWYFVTSNHQSWADILVLQHLLNRKIPMLKFFLKKELIWVPVIGLCWWALDFPFMQRHSKEYLAKHPEKRGTDFDSTRRACEKFQYTPVTVFNFLEGTRFTPDKHELQQSPYTNLLKPKAGGMGFVMGAMGDYIQCFLDITIIYPDKKQPSFWEFLSGQVNHVMVRIEQREIPSQFLGKNYAEDDDFRYDFQQWVTALWEEKDAKIEELHRLSIKKGWSQE